MTGGTGPTPNHQSGSDSDYIVRVIAGVRKGEFIPLRYGITRVGRAASNDVIFNSSTVSRYHAWFVIDEHGLLILDQSATNPTRVRGDVVAEPTAAEPGDLVSIGSNTLEILQLSEADRDELVFNQPAADLDQQLGGDEDAIDGDPTSVEALASMTIDLVVPPDGLDSATYALDPAVVEFNLTPAVEAEPDVDPQAEAEERAAEVEVESPAESEDEAEAEPESVSEAEEQAEADLGEEQEPSTEDSSAEVDDESELQLEPDLAPEAAPEPELDPEAPSEVDEHDDVVILGADPLPDLAHVVVSTPRPSSDRVEAALVRERVAQNSIVLSGLGLANRALTLVSHLMIARLFGASIEADAFYATESLVDLFVVLVAGGLSMVSIPVYRRLQHAAAGRKPDADNFLWSITLVTAAALSLVALVGFVLAPQIAFILAPGAAEAQGLIADLVRVVVIVLVLVAFDAGLRALFNANRIFASPELARFGYSLCVIAAVVFFAPSMGPIAIAVGAVIGAAVMVGIQVARAMSAGLIGRLSFSFDENCRDVLRAVPSSLLVLAWPLAMLMADRAAASSLDTGAVASLGYAGRVVLIAIGIVVLPFATATFPMLADMAVEKRAELGRQVVELVLVALAIIVPLAVIANLTRFDLVALLFEGGEFGTGEVATTGVVVGLYALALPSLAIVFLIRNVFFAIERSGRLAVLSVIGLVVSVIANIVVADRWGLDGVVVSTAVVTSVVAVTSLVMLGADDRIAIDWGHLVGEMAKIFAAAAAAGIGASYALGVGSGAGTRPALMGRGLLVALATAILYVAIGRLLGVRYIRMLLTTITDLALSLIDRLLWWFSESAGRRRLAAAMYLAGAIVGSIAGAAIIGLMLAIAGPRLRGLEPQLLIGAIIGLPLVLYSWRRRGFDHMVFVVFLIFGVVDLEPAPVDGLLAVVVAVGLLAGHIDLNRLWSSTAVVTTVGVMIALSLTSGMVADLPISSLRFTIITIYCIGIMAFVKMYGTTEANLDRMVRGYLIGAVVAVLAVLAAFAGIIPGDMVIGAERGKGFTQDANVFGPFLVVGMFLAIDQARRLDRAEASRRLYLATSLVCAVGVLFTFSRAAWGNTVVTGIAYAYLAGHTFSRKEKVRAAGFLLVASIVLVAALVATGQIEFLLERARFLQSYDNVRFTAQRDGIAFGLTQPLGIGPGMTDVGDRFAPHNTYIRAFAETGLAGLVALFAVFLALLLPVARRIRYSDRYLGMSPQAVAAIAIGHLANGFLIDTLHWRHFWFVLGLVWIQHDRFGRRRSPKTGKTADSSESVNHETATSAEAVETAETVLA